MAIFNSYVSHYQSVYTRHRQVAVLPKPGDAGGGAAESGGDRRVGACWEVGEMGPGEPGSWPGHWFHDVLMVVEWDFNGFHDALMWFNVV